jgi:RHS repeat-associated protein
MNLTADETYWEYVYDHLNQLSSAQHIGDDGESMLVIPGESHEYIYDDIGNRIAVYEGGGDGQYPYLASYTTNLLNQYTARDVPGHVEVVGRTSSGSIDEVKVNTNTAWKLGDIYAKRVTFDNSAAPVVGEISVSEYISSALIRTSWWDAFIPKDPESFTYDADGNLTLDGVWHYTWDAENRLKSMQMRDEVAAVLLTGSNPWARLEFSYDWMGRRIGKVYQTSTSDPATHGGKHGPPILWMIDKDIRYVYDGWMLSMSFNANSLSGCDPDQSFAWGPDLSGGYGGAGGIGGLVAYSDDQHDALNPAPSDPDFLGPMFPIYDGNGNVVKMIRFEDLGSSTFEAREAAAYEYGPFGENRSTTGELGSPSTGGTHQGQRNPFRFSTKYTDAETGLVYYGYRYYSPSMGRWISRDPIQEDGGVNLLAFVGNCSPNFCDPVGLDWLDATGS